MSRTYRRKNNKGNRYWKKDYDPEFYSYILNIPLDGNLKKEVNAFFETDRFNPYGGRTQIIKWHTKKKIRAKQRSEISKILKQLDDYDYDRSCENKNVVPRWVYF